VNVVVLRGVNDDEIDAFVELTRNRDIEVRFIEVCFLCTSAQRLVFCFVSVCRFVVVKSSS
jgi:molybdenum cofactor biosynthesis enzyme MoaA